MRTPTDPAIVAFGGGTGMSCLLTGLKRHSSRITAIVTVTDNGGSSGRLRKDFDMVPPGDIRNCLVALAEGEALLSRVMQYRFEESELEGHSFGNLFVTALTRVTGSFDQAVRELNRLLKVRGRVLPATGSKVSLIATHPDGTKSTGEVQVSASEKPIESVEMRPRGTPAAADVIEAIETADLMVFGPGSLFTSVIPNLLVPGISDAVLANPSDKVYVANIMTQPGETNGMDLAEHLGAIEAHAGAEFITGIVAHSGEIPAVHARHYEAEGATPVGGVETLSSHRSFKLGLGDLIDRRILDGPRAVLRHDPDRLADCIVETFLEPRTDSASLARN